MKALITGVTAFVGSHLSDHLISEGVEVHGVRRPRSRDEFIRKDVHYHDADITDPSGISNIVWEIQPDYIFHLAAQSFVQLSWKAPAATIESNILGTLNMLEAVKNFCPDATIQVACSSEEYGLVTPEETPITEKNLLKPLSPYGVSKVAADLLCQQYYQSYGMQVIITRAFNHTGPRRGEIFAESSFAKQIAEIEKGLKDPVIEVGNLTACRDYTDVRDMVKAYFLAALKCEPGTPYNICSGTTIPIQGVLDYLLTLSTVKDIKIVRDETRMRPSDVQLLLGNCDKFKAKTGWSATIPIQKTLEDLLDYWRKRV